MLIAGDLFVADDGSLATALATHPWAELRGLIGSHDLALVNLECPVTTRGAEIVKSGPSLAGDATLPALIRAGGFTAVTLANNHIMDRGAEGLADTLAACSSAGLLTVGAGHDLAAAREPLVVDAAGVRVAVVNVAEREFSIAGPACAGAAPLDPWSTPQAIAAARAQADAVVAIVHGGNEYFALPRPGLRAACRALVHAGACAVVCHHAHVPLPVEVYEGAPIAYGTGNFLFPAVTPKPAGWYCGYAVSMNVAVTGVASLRLIPYEQGRDGLRCGRSIRPPRASLRSSSAWRTWSPTTRPGPSLGRVLPPSATLRAGPAPGTDTRRAAPAAGGRVALLAPAGEHLARAGRPVTCDSHREIVDELLAEELR